MNQLTDRTLIEVINARHSRQGIWGDRRSPLGNPFDLKTETKRDLVCDLYADYFDQVVNNGREPLEVAKSISTAQNVLIALRWKCPTREQFVAELDRLQALANKGETLRLICWCKPARCHLETVKQYLERG